MQEGARVGFTSGLVPKRVRELLQSQNHSLSVEKDLLGFLSEAGPSYPIHVHTERGVIAAEWDASCVMASKTRLEASGSRVRVQRILADKNDPGQTVQIFSKIGDGLVLDMEKNRLLRFSDASGWYLAQLLQEAPAPAGPPASEDGLQYEPEALFEELPESGEESYAPVIRRPALSSDRPDGFSVASEAFEVSAAFFNDKKLSFAKEQRSSYLKDLSFVSQGAACDVKETELMFRVTLSRTKEPGQMRLKASALWDGQWFDLGDHFSKYFEHLHSLRSALLRKSGLKKKLSRVAFDLLGEKNDAEAELKIHASLKELPLGDADAEWEAGEYLKRFFKTFVSHETEALLVSEGSWFLAGLDFRKWGVLFWEVQSLFDGDLFAWLRLQEKSVPSGELFLKLRELHRRLQARRVELCFNQKPVRVSRVRVKVLAEQKTDAGWFEMRPEVSWEGRPVDDAEWRRILENKGILEENESLWVLDDASLKTLELLGDLLKMPARRGQAASEIRPRIPRTQILDWVLLRKEGAELVLSEENEALVQRLLHFEKIEPKAVPQFFRGSLRDYQKEGYEWLAFLYEHRLGGCLADDMGLGKTVQAIAFLAGLRENIISSAGRPKGNKHLIVVPTTLVFNWKQEFERFYPEFLVAEYGSERRKELDEADIILTTYDILRQEIDSFRKRHFHTIIFDEAQFLKNIFAQRTVAARQLQADFVLTLTGTPLENHIGEYFSILDLSLPGIWGKYEEFRRLEREGHWERLKKRAAPFVLRRTKDKTLKELPAKTENEIYLRMTPRQKALYQKVVSKVRRTVREAFEEKAPAQASLTALTAILRLRQVCVSPRLVDPKSHERSPKMDYLLAKLAELTAEDHSAIVFSQFTSFLDVLEEELQKEKLGYSRMDGSTPTHKRKTLIDAFQCGAAPPIFLVSLKTGGVGLNLVRASYVFHLDPWWNPAVENQASDRVHRIGQKKSVFVTRLLMQHTVEEKMVLLKNKKTALYREALDPAESKNARTGLLTRDDFDFLTS